MIGGKILATVLLSVLVQVSGWPETYRAAVVEYHPSNKITPDLTMAENVKRYIEFIKEAASKRVDIIVFPEGGLFSSIASPIPDPSERIVPCESPTFKTTKAVKDLSCASRENNIYSVVNLLEERKCSANDPNCPSKGYYIFNTNVVFDRNGTVIARYAKYNLFDEFTTNRPAEPEMSFFDTDFNVRFGTFICFDILFQTPTQRLVQQYQIKDFVFTSFWFGELPFLTALQMQRGWAETNNVNLLASGVNHPSKGSGGSGIYNGRFGQIVQVMPEKETSKLLIADVPKFAGPQNSGACKREVPTYLNPHSLNISTRYETVETESSLDLLKDELRPYQTEVIPEGITQKRICTWNDFCCDFEVEMYHLKLEAKNYTYRAVVFNGVRKFGQTFRGGVQTCGIVLCNGPDIKNCTSRVKDIPGLFKFITIRIKGDGFKLRNSFQMPSTLTGGKQLKPLASNQYEFKTKRNELKAEVSLELLWTIYDLDTFAIWGRDFSRDNEPEGPIAGSSALLPISFMLASITGFLFFFR